MRFNTLYSEEPYLDSAPVDYPRAILYQIGTDGRTVRIVSRERDGSEIVRFEGGPYRQGAGGWSDQRFAADIAGFAVAYVERPEEFERGPDDTEQSPENRAWFYRHRDSLASDPE